MSKVFALFLLAAGAAAAGPRCTLAGGAPWQQIRSQHFVIDAAGFKGDPAKLVAAFEDLHAAVLAALVAEPVEIPSKLHAVVLPREYDLIDYTGSNNISGLFWVSSRGEPLILMSADQLESFPQVIAHELTHYISSYLFPRQAFWYSEGLAQFVESVGKPDRDGKRWAGGDAERGLDAGSTQFTSVQHLLYGSSFSTDDYLSAFVFYRYLWNEHPKELSAYQQKLMDGASPEDAWQGAFPQYADNKANALTDHIVRHQRNGKGLHWEVKPGKVDHSYTKAKTSTADVHLALLELKLEQVNKLLHQRVRRQELEEAADEEPGHPVVAMELAQLRQAPLLPALRIATTTAPNDGRGWYLLGLTSTEAAEREAALRKAVALWPDGALSQAALANQLAGSGRAKEALPLANRAVDLAPWHPAAVSSLATVALELGQCKQALVLQTRALEIVQSKSIGSNGGNEAQVKERMADLRKRCPPASAAR